MLGTTALAESAPLGCSASMANAPVIRRSPRQALALGDSAADEIARL